MAVQRHTGFYPWTESEQRTVSRLDSTEKIQRFLDKALYNTEGTPRIPGEVLKARCAHCFDGAVFAASVLSFHGEPAMILDLCAERDDDHILALFRRGGHYGAIAKSNYVGLRYREPIFNNIRELVLSYFESYFNLRREKSLREYSAPFDLRKVRGIKWDQGSAVFDLIAEQLIESPHTRLITPQQKRALLRVDSRTFEAGLTGARRRG
jgi:hypothetical protein